MIPLMVSIDGQNAMLNSSCNGRALISVENVMALISATPITNFGGSEKVCIFVVKLKIVNNFCWRYTIILV